MTRQPVMDCVVVGVGPAGLAASAALSAGGVDHVFGARVERLASDGDGDALDTGDGTVRARS